MAYVQKQLVLPAVAKMLLQAVQVVDVWEEERMSEQAFVVHQLAVVLY